MDEERDSLRKGAGGDTTAARATRAARRAQVTDSFVLRGVRAALAGGGDRCGPATAGTILAHGAVAAGHWLGLAPTTLHMLLGGNEAEQLRLVAESPAGRAALDLIECAEHLAVLTGSQSAARTWLSQRNAALDAVPGDLLAQAGGLDRVLGYLRRLDS